MKPTDLLTHQSFERFSAAQRVLLTILACSATTLLATPLLGYLDLANIVMLFLLTVLLLAVSLGKSIALLAAVLSVALFDFFFVPPRFSLAVSDFQYLITFAVMLATALITGQLVAGLKAKAQEAQQREQGTQALYQAARQLAGALTREQVAAIGRQFAGIRFSAEATLLLPDADALVADAKSGTPAVRIEPQLARVALAGDKPVRSGEPAGSGYATLYLPLKASQRTHGVLALALRADSPEPTAENLELLAALSSLIAIAIERLHYAEVAQAAQVETVSERLRSSILSALSHDLRTPLTALVGLADSLFLIKPRLPDAALDTAQALHEQSARMAGLVENLLDMARLHAGNVSLRREWQPLEEVIGASIKLLGAALASHPVRVSLPPDLPLLEFDAVLLERVFCNLLENAAKYSPAGSTIEIEAGVQEDFAEVRVLDRGAGFARGNGDELFDMFVRGENEASQPGSGLGLAICRAIVEAHGGSIAAGNRPEGGACVRFSLPRGVPPVLEEESA